MLAFSHLNCYIFSIFGWYFRYFVGKKMTLKTVGLYMYVPTKLRKSIIGEGQLPPPPPPLLATLVIVTVFWQLEKTYNYSRDQFQTSVITTHKPCVDIFARISDELKIRWKTRLWQSIFVNIRDFLKSDGGWESKLLGS